VLAQAAETTREHLTPEQMAAVQQDGSDAGGVPVVLVLILALAFILAIAGLWAVFRKAGQPGWAAIVPIYNLIVLLRVAGRPLWWCVLFLIPLVGTIVSIVVSVDVAKAFGKEAGFGVGLALLGFIFYPVLGFGDAQYLGPREEPA
jgi:uncharacterized protein DUF5684